MKRPPHPSDNPAITLPEPPLPVEKRAERAMLLLYGLFFLLWAAGLCLGLAGGGTYLFGMPLWFTVGAVLSYPAICLALHFAIRRFYQ